MCVVVVEDTTDLDNTNNGEEKIYSCQPECSFVSIVYYTCLYYTPSFYMVFTGKFI